MEQLAPERHLPIQEALYPEELETGRGEIDAIGPAHADPSRDSADAISTINTQAWLNQSPWRITSGWCAVASLLSLGILTSLFDWGAFLGWPLVVLAILLVDILWGSIWRFAWGRDGVLPLRDNQQGYAFWLPYIQHDSPAGRLMGRTGLAPLLFRVGLPSLLLTYGVSAVLGPVALGLTSAVVFVTLVGWLTRRARGRPNTLLQAIVTVILPWMLIIALVQATLLGGPTVLQESISSQIGQAQSSIEMAYSRIFYSYVLMSLWALHCWGIYLLRRVTADRQRQEQTAVRNELRAAVESESTALAQLAEAADDGTRLRPWFLSGGVRNLAALLLAVADLGLIGLMLFLQEPLWLALLVPFWLPTWLAYFQGMAVDRQPIWRLAALLLSAIAVGQTPLA